MDPLSVLKNAFLMWKPTNPIPTFSLKSANVFEIQKLLENLKGSSAFGRDEIYSNFMKFGANILAPAVTHVVNLSLGTGNFPAKWKLSRILPLLKSSDSDRLSPSSYRPLSQLPIISKITEKCVQSQLLRHLESNKLLSSDHHAYRKYLSTTTAMLQATDYIMTGVDENKFIATMSLDQTSAFDCVDHKLLLQKLVHYNLDNLSIKWISSYLSHRTNYVAIGSSTSHMYAMNYGVPQGSVLGPILYLLYVNELSAAVKNPECANPSHNDTSRLFGPTCESCGQISIYADDLLYIVTDKDRFNNQIKIEDKFTQLKPFSQSQRPTDQRLENKSH